MHDPVEIATFRQLLKEIPKTPGSAHNNDHIIFITQQIQHIVKNVFEMENTAIVKLSYLSDTTWNTMYGRKQIRNKLN